MNEPSEWVISPLHVEGVRPRIQVTAEPITFGRDLSNSVVLPGDVYPGVSTHHARVCLEGDELILEDLNSRNGTRVNGSAITRTSLSHGITFELGIGGPRFAVVGATGANETVAVTGTMIGRRSVSNDTIVTLREKLGISGAEGVEQKLEQRSRRQVTALLLALGAVVVGAVLLVKGLSERERKVREDLTAQTAALSRELEAARQAVVDQQEAWKRQERELEKARRTWESDRARLVDERRAIEDRIQALAAGGEATAGQLDALNRQLEEAEEALSRFDPLKLEKMRLDKVSAVEKAVVMVEARITYSDARTGRSLFMFDDGLGNLDVNLQGRGEQVANESSGSGFMVGPDGYLITNAHVVNKKNPSTATFRVPNADIRQRVELRVVFSETSWRHNAQLVRFAATGAQDLALLKITPFQDRPFVPVLDLGVDIPPRGSDVYVIGFPYGTKALQEGDTVIASTFKGIASRKVGYYLQVDAAVIKGNSGGPVIDAAGRILGVVTGHQATGVGEGDSSLGLVIPIAEARSVWPP